MKKKIESKKDETTDKKLNISDVSKWFCVTKRECKLRNTDNTCSDNDVCCCYKVSKTVC